MRRRILDAAVRVLHNDGALGFTTTRVAEEARISVGSLYQYFPNKHALVLAIHHDAIELGWEHVRAILDGHPDWPPRRKVVEIAKWFFATEATEAAGLGGVFDDIDVFLRDRAGDAIDAAAYDRFARFLRASSPRRRTPATLRFDTQLLMTTLESVGKTVATRDLSRRARDRWATATATMLCDHLDIGA
jgi:AcrR family transcriptional regulator